MVTSTHMVKLYVLVCQIYQVFLFDRCPETSGKFTDVVTCSGYVWIEPASFIELGQNISINCYYAIEPCQQAKLYMKLNDHRIEDSLSIINKTTVQLQLHHFKNRFSYVHCYARCPQEQYICGTYFCMGYLPDRPTNVTCVLYEHSDNIKCTWNPGKDTHLNTVYKLHLKSAEKEVIHFSTRGTSFLIPLKQLQKSQTFSVWIGAKNELGMARSEEMNFDLNELVIPATPVIIWNKTIDSPVFKTIIQWKKRTEINDTYCEERFKEVTSYLWQVRKWNADFKRDHHMEYNLDANTNYEFQVRCKLNTARSLWSNWSEPVHYKTPEAEPSSVLEVWRQLGPTYQNGSQEVTILLKPFLPKQSRGRILGYKVFCENQGESINLCNTTETKCKVLVPAMVTIVYITAHNSKGSSRPANITLRQEPHNSYDFQPPSKMKINNEDQKRISVIWNPPKYIGKPVLWYIVEWTFAVLNTHRHQDILWKKVPSQITTTYIQDVRMKYYINISVYAVYQDGISKPCSGQFSLLTFQEDNHERLSADPNDDNAGVLLGIGVGVAISCIFLLALTAKESCRKRVGRVFSSVTPKWLFEDYPKLQKSGMVQLLQGSNGSSLAHNSTWLFLNYEDTVITEVEETLVAPKECQVLDDKTESTEMESKHVNSEQDALCDVIDSDMTEENGYKPQVSNKAFFGSVFNSSYNMHSPNLDTKSNSSASPMDVLLKDCTSPIVSLWPIEETDENTFLFEKISLVLNNSKSGQSNVFGSTNDKPALSMEKQWKIPLANDSVQEQTLIVPDELLSCLRVSNEDSADLMSYFPQRVAK